MDKTFDELFNDFFEEPKGGDNSINLNDLPPEVQDDLLAIMHVYGCIDEIMNQALGEGMAAELGPPDETEQFSENGINYEKMTWFTNKGHLVQLAIVEGDFKGMDYPVKRQPKSLEEQLADAIKVENYEHAATLRDAIAKRDSEG